MLTRFWMTRDPKVIDPETAIAVAAQVMTRADIRRLPVVDKGRTGKTGRLVGIVSMSDLMRAFPSHINPLAATVERSMAPFPVSTIMTTDPTTASPNMPLEKVSRIMIAQKIGALPVVRDGIIEGIITESDVFRALNTILGASPTTTRITFDLGADPHPFETVFQLAQRHDVEVLSFLTIRERERPVGVLRVRGAGYDDFVDALWKSKHQVLHVVAPSGASLHPKAD